jgi:hypothetical protein
MPPARATRRRSPVAAALAIALLASFTTSHGQGPVPAHQDITYILPAWTGFAAATTPDVIAETAELRTRIGEGQYVRVGFTANVAVSMSSWTVDTTSPAAVSAALAPVFAQIDAYVAKAEGAGIPLALNILTAGGAQYDPVQTASEQEDRRSMQWYADGALAPGWWTHTRYARKARRVQEAYVREIGRYLAKTMALHPDTLVAASGDREVELTSDRSPIVDSAYTPATTVLADYSPFALAEFRDWLRRGGLYASDPAFANDAYAFSSRYDGDATPATDTNHDGHTLNGDFNTAFTTWDLKHFEWTLADPVDGDPHAIPASVYQAPGFNPLPNGNATGFDAPRTRTPGNSWWETWSLFRQTMIARHNRDFSRWITTTADPVTSTVVPVDRWFSYQIPADYLFGGTPATPNFRLVTSASSMSTADVSPYGGLGVVSINANTGGPGANGPYAKTLTALAPAIAQRNVRWAILEWNPSEPVSTDLAVYRADMTLVERYRPSVLVPYAWPNDAAGHYQTKNTGFETALHELVGRIADVPGTCRYQLPGSASVPGTAGSGSFQVSTSASNCPWTATSDAAWLTITSGSPGTGTGTLAYSVAANPTAAVRTGTITIAAQTFTVTQGAAPCSFTLTPTSATAGGAGGSATVGVTTAPGCSWLATSESSFLNVTSGSSGTGSGTVGYSVAFNPATVTRTGTITIANQAFTVTQDPSPCSFVLGGGPSAAIPVGGATAQVQVTTDARCSWTASTDGSPFVSLISGTSVTGPGVVRYRVDPNPTGVLRTAVLTIGGQTFTIAQSGGKVLKDWVNDGARHLGVYKPGSGTWTIEGLADQSWGQPGDVPVPGDYNGDALLDIAVYRPSTGQWFVRDQFTMQWGRAGDIPVPGDYDGDGDTEPAVVRITDGPMAIWYIPGRFPMQWGMRGDIPVPGDYDGDRRTDLAVWRPATGTWYIAYSGTGFGTTAAIQFGIPGDEPMPGDFDGDGRTDLGLYRDSGLIFYFTTAASNYSFTQNVLALVFSGTLVPLPFAIDTNKDAIDDFCIFTGTLITCSGLGGASVNLSIPSAVAAVPLGERPQLHSVQASDLDGDHRSDFTVYRDTTSQWFSEKTQGIPFTPLGTTTQFGQNGDIPVPGDYDGDHRSDLAVYRPSTGQWILRFTFTSPPTTRTESWGASTDVPVPADYDGDGRTELAVFRPSTGEWLIRWSSTDYVSVSVVQWGLPGDIPKPADYDGDGRADFVVYRPSDSMWYLRLSTTAFGSVIVRQWGLTDDVPVTGDFDGDGRTDLAVYRPSSGLWYVLDALTGQEQPVRQWGLPGDIPVPHDFDGDGATDLAIFRPSSATWYVTLSASGQIVVRQQGLSTDKPL